MKKIKITIGIVVVLLFSVVVYFLDGLMPIGSGYTAKYLCSQVFLANREPNSVFQNDVKPTNPLFLMFDYKVDYKNKTVTSAGFGSWRPATAVYREGFGCTLAIGVSRFDLMAQVENAPKFETPNQDMYWPKGAILDQTSFPREIDRQKLDLIVEKAFEEPYSKKLRNTQAVVVAYKGNIVAEKYQRPFLPNTPMLGWSMSKSVTNSLMGILVKKGVIRIKDNAPVEAWQDSTDPRNKITTDQLLRMSSGLEFEEVYGPYSDATEMLYHSKSMADFAVAKPLVAEPDTVWNYSSGSANITSRIIRDLVGGNLVAFNSFARKELFEKLYMYTAIIEPDASGSFVGSSYMFASARDWAKIGLLYLNDGLWEGERILPEGWVKYSTTPTAGSPLGEYGAMIWLNSGEPGNPSNRTYPSLPQDMFWFDGFNEQIVAIFPSKNLVVVRLGATHDKNAWNVEKFLVDILSTIEL